MDPKIYSTAVARLLGLPVYNNSIPSSLPAIYGCTGLQEDPGYYYTTQPSTQLDVQAGGIGGFESADGETGVVGPYG